MDIVVFSLIVIVFGLILLSSLGMLCFVSAIFNQWAYRNVMPIKDPRRRRIVLIAAGIALMVIPAVIILILNLFLRPHDQI